MVVDVFVQMVVQQFRAGVGRIGMTVLAGKGAFHYGHGRTAAGDFVIPGLVAFRALEVIAPHVDVTVSVRFQQLAGEIRMFHRFTSATVEMALPAGFSRGGAHVFGHGHQVHFGIRHAGAGGGFLVCAGGIVADQTIDVGLVCEIKRVVFPSVSGMTACATSLVADDAHSEIVDGGCRLAVPDLLSMFEGIR